MRLTRWIGSIDIPGGVTHFQEVGLLSQPVPEPDAVAELGLAKPRMDQADFTAYPLSDNSPHLLTEHILADLPYPVEVLVLDGVNPVFDSPDPDRGHQVWRSRRTDRPGPSPNCQGA